MCFYYDDYCEAYHSEIRKCRKNYMCGGCSGKINVGDLCVYTSGIFEGDPFSERYCGACEHTRHRIHLKELKEGCREQNSWISYDELFDYCIEEPFQKSGHEEGQIHLMRERLLSTKKGGQ